MKTRTALLMVSLATAAALPAYAQPAQAGGAPAASVAQDRDQVRDQDRIYDQDRDQDQDRDRLYDQDQDRDRDQDRDKDQDGDRDQDRDQDRIRDRDTIYGYDLMTEEERIAYRNQMRSLATEREREQFRMEHHERMKERAKARGVEIPDEPMQRQHRRQDMPMHQAPARPAPQPPKRRGN